MSHLQQITPWVARGIAILVVLFMAAFAQDAIDEGPRALTLHLLPALALLIVVVIAWRWELVGAIVFTALAMWYASMNWGNVGWIVTISGPLAATPTTSCLTSLALDVAFWPLIEIVRPTMPGSPP